MENVLVRGCSASESCDLSGGVGETGHTEPLSGLDGAAELDDGALAITGTVALPAGRRVACSRTRCSLGAI